MTIAPAEDRLRIILELARRLNSTSELAEVMPLVIREVTSLLGADRGVLLLDHGGVDLEAAFACGRGSTEPSEELRALSRSVIEQVRSTRRPVITVDASNDPRFSAQASVRLVGIRSVACVPLRSGRRLLGALYVDCLGVQRLLAKQDLPLVEAVAEVATLALEKARHQTRMLQAARCIEEFGSSLDLREVLRLLLRRMVQLTRAEQGFVLLCDPLSGETAVFGGEDRSGKPLPDGASPYLSQTIVQRVLTSGEPILSDNIRADQAFDPVDSVKALGLTSVLCVPIRTRGRSLGVVYLQNHIQPAVFAEQDQRLLQMVANHAGIALENARLYGQEKEVVQALANAVEARDLATSSHVQRVCEHAVAVGRLLGLPEERVAELEQAAVLHDVGKIGIPDRILRKPAALDAEERREMQLHPQLGAQIVLPVRLPPAVQEAILTHHERFDGSGYPAGLRGHDIPLYGRVLAVVDAYDAMVSDRPYRPAMRHEQATSELRCCAGTQFDPEVVAAFLRVLASSGR